MLFSIIVKAVVEGIKDNKVALLHSKKKCAKIHTLFREEEDSDMVSGPMGKPGQR